MYVYLRSEPQLWTVGHFDPTGKFHPESDHGRAEEAAERAAWLNGGRRPTICKGAGEIIERPLHPGRVEALPGAREAELLAALQAVLAGWDEWAHRGQIEAAIENARRLVFACPIPPRPSAMIEDCGQD